MPLSTTSGEPAVPLHVLTPDGFRDWQAEQAPPVAGWVEAMGFKAGLGEALVVPDGAGGIAAALLGWGAEAPRRRDRFHLAGAIAKLPVGRYAIAEGGAAIDVELELLGVLMGEYRFTRYRDASGPRHEIVAPEGVDAARLTRIAAAAAMAQDLINTPANDLGPEALEAAFLDLAGVQGAETRVTRGVEELRAAGFPLIAAVGAAAVEAPRLLEMTWGRPDAPRVTLVGKGVCFDTGGLDIKRSSAMGLMKKDMGGAATTLGLARMIMEAGLDLRLRVLIPAVENAISAAAMRPGDILPSRKGLTVEINNTDAEGRLVLADALALADEEAPGLIVSLATLTGAARVALGADVPPFYTDDDGLAAALAAASTAVADPLWRMPFWTPYEGLIEPGIADLDNAPSGGMAGSITAALFLRRFVEKAGAYLHVDIYGWTPSAKPARPKGGAFQAARAIFAVLEAGSWRRA